MADDDVQVVENGERGAPALVLLTNAAAPSALWEPVVPALAAAHHVVRVDLTGHGRPPRYDVPAQASRVAAVLDALGVDRVTAIGHSSGCLVATALAEQRPDLVVALSLLDMGPDLAAQVPEGLLFRLVKRRFPGALIWRLADPGSMVKSAGGTTRPVEIPAAWTAHLRRMTHRDFAGLMRSYAAYLGRRGLPDRLRGSGLPLLVVFGAEDRRWRPSAADAYRVVPGVRIEMLPGVGHTPPLEDPGTTARLLLEFVAAVEHRR